jgi:GNAT superfamily N-acetyltransferase
MQVTVHTVRMLFEPEVTMNTAAPFLQEAVRFISGLLDDIDDLPASDVPAAAVGIRAARAGDEAAVSALVAGLSAQSRHYRFFIPLRELPPKMLARFTHADPASELTLFATARVDGREVLVGMANYVVEQALQRAEYAVVVDDAWQGQGIAHRLLAALEERARKAGLDCLFGEVLTENTAMLAFAEKQGFEVGRHPDDVALTLTWKNLRHDQMAPRFEMERGASACCHH